VMHHTGVGNAVDIFIYYRSSTDGYAFSAATEIYNAAGEEWSPAGVHFDGTTWRLFALGDIGGGYGPLKLFSGASADNLAGPTTISGIETFVGGGDLDMIGDNIALLTLLDNATTGTMSTRIIDVVNYPTLVSDPIESWAFAADRTQAAVYLDRSTTKWIMIQDDATAENKRVYIASAANDNLPAIRFDDFAGTGALSANWTVGTGTLSRDSGAVKATVAADSIAYRNDTTFPNDQYAIATVSGMVTEWEDMAGVAIGCSGTGVTFNGYSAYTDGVISADHTQVLKWVDGTSSAVDNITTGTAWSSGDRMKLSRHNSGASQVLRVWRDSGAGWVQMGSDISDATHQSGGAPGIHVGYTATSHASVDNFEGGGAGEVGGQTGPDVTDPYVDGYAPPSSQTGVSVGTTSAVLHVKDNGIGVDTLTIQMTRTGGTVQTCGDNLVCTGSAGDITVTYPGLSLSYGDNVSFQIAASDLSANAMDNVSYWFSVQSDPGAGGTLLVGDNTVGDSTVNVTSNWTYTTEYTAQLSGTANTIWIYYGNTNATSCKASIYVGNTTTGALLDSVTIPVSGTGWKSGTLTGEVSIVSGNKYRLGVVCNGYELIGSDSVGGYKICKSGTYASPPDPNCATSTGGKDIDAYVTN